MISIIIPTFNRFELLKNSIESILKHNSNFALYEILVVDNGSKDRTKNAVEDIQKSNPKLPLHYFYDEIPGLLTGRHRGYKEAKGEILTFIDDDVEVSETWLDGIIDCMNSRPEIALLTGPCLPKYEIAPPAWLDYFWTNDQNGFHCGWLSLLDFGTEEKEIDPLFVWGLNFTIRREVFEKLKGFNPDNVPKFMQEFQGDGETGLTLKAKNNNLKALYSPKVGLFHVVSKGRLTLEYFEQRAFYQGVANSFTELKNKCFHFDETRKISLFTKIKRKIKKTIGLPNQKSLPLDIIEMKTKLSFKEQEGFQFHQDVYIQNPEVKKWVNKENYLDYNLPKNDKKEN
jgi:glucosyl-dolichyl phosphate glucuronosyltransferase